MKKMFLALSVLTLSLTGCEGNDDNNNTVLTSEITVDDVGFRPSQNGISTYFIEGDADVKDRRHFSLIKGSEENISQAIYVNIELREGQSNDGGSYIFHLGETATNLFANGIYVEGDMTYQLASGTLHVTEMTDGYYKLIFEDVQAINALNPNGPGHRISGELKAKFKVIDPLTD